MTERWRRNDREAPISIYEVHLGSWRRNLAEGGRYLTYRELAEQLVPYVAGLGFTHIELMPVTEYPFDGSWGYQPVSLFAPTSALWHARRFPRLRRCLPRGRELGVWLDWVPGHFPTDAHGLGAIRRHRALRARRPAPGVPPRLEHADLQLRPARGRQFPAVQRAVLAQRVPYRRAAGRCGRVDAVSRLQPQAGRVDPEPVRRTREPRSDRVSAADERAGVRRSGRARRRRPRSRPRGRWCRGRSMSAAWASASNGTWGGCTTR